MISYEHKFVFIHVAKSGGSSIRNRLQTDSDEQKFKFGHKGATARIDFLGDAYYDYFSFAFVRNPWARLVSAFQYLKNGGCGYLYDKRMQTRLSSFNNLNEFVLANRRPGGNLLKHQAHFRYQYDMLVSPAGKCLVDFIGKYENLQEDFNIVCDKIGIPQQELPHENKTKHKHYTEYYNDETRQIVAEKYAKDIEYFGYKYGE